MAEIKKFKTPAVKAVFIHANRTATDGHKHSNENIDLDRTKYNYRLKTGGVKEWILSNVDFPQPDAPRSI